MGRERDEVVRDMFSEMAYSAADRVEQLGECGEEEMRLLALFILGLESVRGDIRELRSRVDALERGREPQGTQRPEEGEWAGVDDVDDMDGEDSVT